MSGSVIGLLVTRNEEDIIEEVLREYEKQGFDAIYAFDSSEDNTLEIIKSFSFVKYAIKDVDIGFDRNTTIYGKIAEHLFQRAVKDCGYGNWIFATHGDEIYHNNVEDTLNKIDPKEYNLLYALQVTFVLHESERETIKYEDKKESIQKRRLWYFFVYREPRAFYNAPNMRYDVNDRTRIHPWWNDDEEYRTSPWLLLVKNYPAREPEHFKERILDRASRWQLSYLKFLPNLFINHLSDAMGEWNNPDIYSSPLLEFDGKFRLYKCKDYLFDHIVGSEHFRGDPIPDPR